MRTRLGRKIFRALYKQYLSKYKKIGDEDHFLDYIKQNYPQYEEVTIHCLRKQKFLGTNKELMAEFEKLNTQSKEKFYKVVTDKELKKKIKDSLFQNDKENAKKACLNKYGDEVVCNFVVRIFADKLAQKQK